MIQYKTHLHNKYGDILEEGIWYRFDEKTLLHFDDPVEMVDFANDILKNADAIIKEWREYEEE